MGSLQILNSLVRFEVFTTKTIWIAAFVIFCRAVFCIITEVSESPLDAIFISFTEDGGSSFLEYVPNFLPEICCSVC
jgi:hypothetical protein